MKCSFPGERDGQNDLLIDIVGLTDQFSKIFLIVIVAQCSSLLSGGWRDGWIDGWMDRQTDRQTNRQMDGLMDGWTDGRRDGWIDR